MRLVRLALFGALVAAAPACTNDGGSSFFIVQNQVPTEGCVIPSDVGSGFLSKGTIEASAETGYIFTPVVQSLLTTMEGAAADRVIFVQGADISLSFPRGELDDVPTFRQRFSGSVFPGGTTSFGFELVPLDTLEDVAAVLGDGAGAVSISAEITLIGTVDGGDVDAEPYFYNIDVCNGCLVQDLGNCADLPEGITIDQGGQCQIFQDAPVDCCMDDTLGFLCPAVATGA